MFHLSLEHLLLSQLSWPIFLWCLIFLGIGSLFIFNFLYIQFINQRYIATVVGQKKQKQSYWTVFEYVNAEKEKIRAISCSGRSVPYHFIDRQKIKIHIDQKKPHDAQINQYFWLFFGIFLFVVSAVILLLLNAQLSASMWLSLMVILFLSTFKFFANLKITRKDKKLRSSIWREEDTKEIITIDEIMSIPKIQNYHKSNLIYAGRGLLIGSIFFIFGIGALFQSLNEIELIDSIILIMIALYIPGICLLIGSIIISNTLRNKRIAQELGFSS